jgi:exodeoxyribonuclease-3
MKIATWNVNGIRARQGQLLDWLASEKPDIVCLQEIKASLDQLPFELRDVDNYWSYWHGDKGYSGVGLHVRKAFAVISPPVVVRR